MDKEHLSKDEYIDWLKTRVQSLEGSNLWYYSAFEMLASLGDLHKNFKQNNDPGALYNEARKKLKTLVDFETLSFFQVNSEDSSFQLADCDPEIDRGLIREEVDRQIENGTFAWALKQGRGIVVQDKFSNKRLFLHSLTTKSRVIGMFAGRLRGNFSKLPSERLTLASIIFDNTAYAIENGFFYKHISDQNRTLEQAVHARTRELEKTTEELKREIFTRKRSDEAYKVLARHNESILMFAEEGILGIDLNGIISFINPCGAKMLGYGPEEMIGSPVHTLLSPSNKDGIPYSLEDSPIQKAIDTKKPCRLSDAIFWKKSSQGMPVEYSCNPILETGKIKGAVVTFRDITERKIAEANQKAFEEKLIASNKELQDFTFIASHDLQEPLRKLLMYGNRLKSDYEYYLDGKAKDYLNHIEKSSIKMRRLIEGLLEFSTITTDAHPFEEIDLVKVISEVLSDLVNPIIKTGARIKVGRLPKIEADSGQMRQLFFHLVHNCLKFQKSDESLVVTISGHEEGDDFWSIRVHDNGRGFDEKHLEKIFKPFQQLHIAREFSGQGIGLTICQKIVQRHGGTITAKSAPKKGSTFIVKLPEKNTNYSRDK